MKSESKSLQTCGGSGWDTIKWKQNLYELMNIEIARSNYAMLMERTLPPLAAG